MVELVFVVLVVLCLLLDAVDLVAEVSPRECPWAAPGRRANDGATRALLAGGGLFLSIVAAGAMLWGWGYWCVWGVVAESEACTDTSAGDAVANVFGTDAYRPSSSTTFQGNWCVHACMQEHLHCVTKNIVRDSRLQTGGPQLSAVRVEGRGDSGEESAGLKRRAC